MLAGFNVVFVAIFAAEAVCKVTALGPRVYVHDGWNRFDFVVAAVSILGLVISTGVGANAVRVLRVARVFRLVKRAKALRVMFNSLVLSLPALWNISSFIFVVMFVFAILGTSWLSRGWKFVQRRQDCHVCGSCWLWRAGMSFFGSYTDFDPHTNFTTFPLTLVTIMRVITQDSWETVLFTARSHSDYAPLYFIAVMVMVGMVMVNLFMAVVVVRTDAWCHCCRAATLPGSGH